MGYIVVYRSDDLLNEMKRLKFTNRTIYNWKSDFSPGPKSKTGKSKVRVYTPFHMDKHTQFKGLNLCEYIKGEKHFIIEKEKNYLKKGKKLIFPLPDIEII